jgi:hypothetical protein
MPFPALTVRWCDIAWEAMALELPGRMELLNRCSGLLLRGLGQVDGRGNGG